MKLKLMSTMIIAIFLSCSVFGNVKKRTVLADLAGVFTSPISETSHHSFQVKNIGATSATAEVTLSMYSKSEVISARYVCVLDLEGVDVPDTF